MKKSLKLVIAVFAMLAMAAVSFAANTAQINVTSEPIQQDATCDKAGGFAITFDDGTTFAGGDQITFDLDLGVTLCKTIDLEIGLAANAAGTHAGGFSAAYALPVIGTDNPLTATNVLDVLVDGAASSGRGLIFKITGVIGSARVTINVMSIDAAGVLGSDATESITFSAAAGDTTDVLALSFLDQNTYDTAVMGTTAGIYAPTVVGGSIYEGNDATLAQNTLCIDVSDPDFTAVVVNANFDSKLDKFTWIPSNPQVAHVVAATSLQLDTCSKGFTGYIELPGTATQTQSISCAIIQNESVYEGDDGFCEDTHDRNNMIIRTSDGSPFEALAYQVELEILINGESGANGVYWSNQDVMADGYDSLSAACDATNTSGVAIDTDRYYLANGYTATPGTDTDCSIGSSAKAVKLITVESDLDLGPTNDYLYINLPGMVFDSTEFVAGDVLSVKVTLHKAPCGQLFTGTWEIGTAGCEVEGVSQSLIYPYFGKSGSFLNAIVVTNLGDVAGTASFTLYEQDGDAFTASAPVGARSMFVDLLDNLTWTQIAGTGIQGDSKGYVLVSTDFSVDGAAMITNPTTGESIGYLPRK